MYQLLELWHNSVCCTPAPHGHTHELNLDIARLNEPNKCVAYTPLGERPSSGTAYAALKECSRA